MVGAEGRDDGNSGGAMKVDLRQIGHHAYEVRGDDSRAIEVVRLVDGASGRRVWVVDGLPGVEFGNREAAVRRVALLAARGGEV